MSLSIDGHYCGNVYVIRCFGRIGTGKECSILEAAINRALVEFTRFVIDVAGVTRVDSTGLGMLVRFLSHTRRRDGDLRIAAPQPFLTSVLQFTKLATIFRVYDTEEAAIVSFLKDPSTVVADREPAGPLVLFVDPSPDLCAFVKTLLNTRGYEVIFACHMYDARLLLSAATIQYLVVGPDAFHLSSETEIASLKALAPSATTVLLGNGFKLEDPDRAGSELLEKMQAQA
jgi:anti-anti-sigma factor